MSSQWYSLMHSLKGRQSHTPHALRDAQLLIAEYFSFVRQPDACPSVHRTWSPYYEVNIYHSCRLPRGHLGVHQHDGWHPNFGWSPYYRVSSRRINWDI